MPQLIIKVQNKIAKPLNDFIVCGNSDYTVKFCFDTEWEDQPIKTARFIWNNQYQDVVFEGNVCPMPVIENATILGVGVYAGSLSTTTPAIIHCTKSVLCGLGCPSDPPEDVYNQIIEILNEGLAVTSKEIKELQNKHEADIEAVETKHNSDITNIETKHDTDFKNLQGQIDNIVIETSESGDVTAEVAQARVDNNGGNHSTLKARLDITDETLSHNGLATAITNYTLGYYIDCSGETVNTSELIESTSPNMAVAVLNCSEGDWFSLDATGGEFARAYCFIDINGNVLKVASAGNHVQKDVVAPVDAAQIIIHDTNGFATSSYVGKPLSEIKQDTIIKLVEVDDWTDNRGINSTTGGDKSTSTIFKASDFISVDRFKYLYITRAITENASAFGIAFYTYKKEYISGIANEKGSEKRAEKYLIEMPEGTRYFRTTFFMENTYGDFSCYGVTEEFDTLNSLCKIGYNKIDFHNYEIVSGMLNAIKDGYSGWINTSEKTYKTSKTFIPASDFYKVIHKLTTDENGINMYFILCEYESIPEVDSSTTTQCLRRTSFTAENIEYIKLLDNTKYIRFSYGRARATGIEMTDADMEKYFDCEAELKVADNIKDYVNDVILDITDTKRPYTDSEIRFTFETNSCVCTSEATTEDDGSTNTVTTRKGILVLPTNYTPNGKPVPVIMLCHGYTGYVSDTYWYPGNQEDTEPWITTLRNNGFAVFDVDNLTKQHTGSGSTDLGCPELVESYRKAFDYIKQNYNVEDKMSIYSMSMGTFTAVNYMSMYREDIKCALLAGPRTDIKGFYGNNMGSYRAGIFGFEDTTGATYEDEKMKPFDMYRNIVELNSVKYLFKDFPPCKFLVGKVDITENESQGTWVNGCYDLADALKNNGNLVTLRTVDGYNHADICHIVGDNLISECLLWFRKYGIG